ncbi:MAG: hypothetical protein WC479_08410 [Candidatus Izemoplasmatales bacterium]|jgi:hypothetical protein
MGLVTVKQITDLLQDVEDFDIADWSDNEALDNGAGLLEVADEYAQPYFEEILCKGKTFDYATYTELYDGNGLFNLRLTNKPVQEILSVTINDEAQDLTEIYRYTNRIARKVEFPIGMQNIQVVYKAGYEAAPKPVIMAIAMLTAMHISRVVGGGGDALSTSITAGPITLKEAFSAAGKYAAKISSWNHQVNLTARRYGGTKILSKPRMKSDRERNYDPRTDSFV